MLQNYGNLVVNINTLKFIIIKTSKRIIQEPGTCFYYSLFRDFWRRQSRRQKSRKELKHAVQSGLKSSV